MKETIFILLLIISASTIVTAQTEMRARVVPPTTNTKTEIEKIKSDLERLESERVKIVTKLGVPADFTLKQALDFIKLKINCNCDLKVLPPTPTIQPPRKKTIQKQNTKRTIRPKKKVYKKPKIVTTAPLRC